MNYESWISFRYLTSKKDRFLWVIHFVSVAGIAIGVMALIVVIGVMTGFDRDLRDKIIGTNAHIVVEKETGLGDYAAVQQGLREIRGIKATTPYIHGNVFLESQYRTMSLILRGLDPATDGDVTKINDYLTEGRLADLKEGDVIIGSQLASYFGFTVGDGLTIIAPASGMAGEQWRYRLKVAGIFNSGMYDYDMNLILVHLNQAQAIFHLPPEIVSGVAVKLNDINQAAKIKQNIYKTMGYNFLVRTWIESNRNFFAALKLEKFAMFVILTLIVLVAALNIASTLIVTVTSRVKDIGILKAIGVPNRSIQRIFTIEGLAIGMVGTLFGLLGGVGLSFILKKYQFIKLPQEIYYVDRLPVLLNLNDILMIVGAAILISYLATLYPARKAANLEPVEALRYE